MKVSEGKMKDPHPLNSTWIKTSDKEVISVPATHKKFKRKSREPKRLFSSPEPDRMKSFLTDMSDMDSVDDPRADSCGVSRLVPRRHMILSQETTAASFLSGAPGVTGSSSHTGAIDMRIGNNGPAITSKLSQLPTSPFSNQEIVHWPTAISQPLSNRFKLGPRSTYPTSPSQQMFSLELPMSGHTAPLPSPRAPQTPNCQEALELQGQSPKEPSRKRFGVSADGPIHVPEVKAIQQTRRLLANARERTRVHTISAAFEALRKQVPCYSYGQKLSKLAILRIACNYILSLAQLAELDYSSDRSSRSFSQCVEQCTRTLQAEGKSKKRKVGRMPEDV